MAYDTNEVAFFSMSGLHYFPNMSTISSPITLFMLNILLIHYYLDIWQ